MPSTATPSTYATGGPVQSVSVPLAGCTPPRLPEPLPLLANSAAEQLQQIDELLERFHYDTHRGSFRFCTERPCREIAAVRRGDHL